MKPIAFDYVRPRRLDEALAHLAERADAQVLAGGQSLVPLLNQRTARPGVLVDVNDVAGLDRLRWDAHTLDVGATARQRRLELDADVRTRIPMLADALPLIGRVATRNRGTVGGSLAHADPAAELPAVAVACGAEVSIASADGVRRVAAERFFVAAHRTVLAAGELVIGVRFPVPPPRTGQAWVEYGRRYADLPLVGLACGLTLDAGGAIEGATLVCSGVGEKPWRVPVADLLAGAGPEAFEEVARAAAAQCAPAGDARTDASHRRRLVYALILRALQSAWNRAGERA